MYNQGILSLTQSGVFRTVDARCTVYSIVHFVEKDLLYIVSRSVLWSRAPPGAFFAGAGAALMGRLRLQLFFVKKTL